MRYAGNSSTYSDHSKSIVIKDADSEIKLCDPVECSTLEIRSQAQRSTRDPGEAAEAELEARNKQYTYPNQNTDTTYTGAATMAMYNLASGAIGLGESSLSFLTYWGSK
jgi:hypothetical protein